ncbi:hypothetical protein KFZ70_04480 [Tamlana fucoidanivorans]|uniref:PorT family protein n=1 Tax=Allotamlana fucoidanivorans TaxID=2583814 RepID=A0A5C4SS10_9FLAO|nr:hypothetical protein [Tamlana fucoidanivorans]TNJ47220.1 hypothetical protein FGF67_01495 [Tamlana fucoidanivorans]
MSEKKHIDRIFQERFKDFEATPNDAVWNNIEAQLNEKKKKRRIIPIWWRYAGIAALLALLFTVGTLIFNDTDTEQEFQIVDTENNPSTSTHINAISDELSKPTSTDSVETPVTHPTSVASNNSSVSSTKSNSSIIRQNIQKNTLQNAKNPSDSEDVGHKTSIKTSVQLKNQTAFTKNQVNQAPSKASAILINKDEVKAFIQEASKNNSVASSESETLNNSINKKDEREKNHTNTLTIEEAIENNKVLTEKEKQPNNRWSVAPNAAPVYFSTLGDGSSIDEQFNRNPKSGDINMSYGISTSYAINDKIKIRSGINKVNLGYNTNNVIVYQSSRSSSSALQNVNTVDKNNESVSFASKETLNIVSPETFSTSNTTINQNLGYIEIPLEIQYAISNSRLGINVIGGFSSFFLSDNEIHRENQNGQRDYLGEANNINSTSYSANLGFGLNYKFTKKVDLNLEPMFKYQFNTFKNTSGNFTPFFIGIYTGFAIKF